MTKNYRTVSWSIEQDGIAKIPSSWSEETNEKIYLKKRKGQPVRKRLSCIFITEKPRN